MRSLNITGCYVFQDLFPLAAASYGAPKGLTEPRTNRQYQRTTSEHDSERFSGEPYRCGSEERPTLIVLARLMHVFVSWHPPAEGCPPERKVDTNNEPGTMNTRDVRVRSAQREHHRCNQLENICAGMAPCVGRYWRVISSHLGERHLSVQGLWNRSNSKVVEIRPRNARGQG